MEKKHFLKKFENQSAYESQKDSVMGMPHVVLFEDTKEVIFALDENFYSKEFFTIEALIDGTVGIGIPSSASSLKYRKNNEPWVEISEATQLSVVANDTIQISCVSDDFKNNDSCTSIFDISASFNVKGNIMSLLYGDNFEGQTDLSGKNGAFWSLFAYCTSIVNAENLILPATTLTKSCYSNMFYGCTNLTTAPELLATKLADECYQNMFYGCSKLNYIKMLATDIDANDCLYSWVKNVSSSGTFVKNANMDSLPRGENGIPERWTVENA
jgi:hypothetical protein